MKSITYFSRNEAMSLSPEDPVHDPPGPAGRAQVVVEHHVALARARTAGSPPRQPARGRRAAAGRPACPGPARSRCAPGWRTATPRPAPRRRRAPIRSCSTATCSASSVLVVRSSGIRPACSIWSSCTVHSTSERPPRPSLKLVAGSAPRGQPLGVHARLDPAYLDHVVPGEPLLGEAQRVDQVLEPRAQVRVADDRGRAQQRLRLPDRRPLAVVGGVGVQRAHQRTLPALGPQRRCPPRGRGRATAR